MTTKKSIIITVIVVFIMIAALVTITFFTGRMQWNDENTIGNLAGNLNNGGLFCESDGKVYFANAYADNALYVMNSDGSEMKKLSDNSVSSINAAGDYIYYYMESSKNGKGLGYMGRTSGIYRSKKDGKQVTCLNRTYAVSMQLCGNYLYYQNYNNKTGTTLEKIKIDKTDLTTVADYVINPASFSNGRIYFNGTQDDHALYMLETGSDRISSIWQGDIWNPIYQDGYVYYMDVPNHYRLCRYSMYDNTVEILTNERVEFFNIYSSYIYYQTNSKKDPALKRMYIDGSNPEVVASGNYKNINITSQYVYFNQFGENVPVYRTSTFGPVFVTTFDAAKNAALEDMK